MVFDSALDMGVFIDYDWNFESNHNEKSVPKNISNWRKRSYSSEFNEEIKVPYKIPNYYCKQFTLCLQGIADAMEVGLYIHSASVGTELIHGKGLNHFGSFNVQTVHS